ncbi:MAG: DUF5615 family PIN-like protein [Gemmatimonadales bacterium]|nr:DUF5615 family PIN-like protein [Gemmatimonadales bacterium]
MRLLADENIPLESVRALRHAGHDVFAATESAPGQHDQAHLERAGVEQRVILTFDQDFGELAARGFARSVPGVILVRMVPKDASAVTALLLDLFGRPEIEWLGHLSVIDPNHIRQRPL